MTKSSIGGVALLIFAGFAFLFGSYGVMNAIVVAKPGAGSALIHVVVLAVGVCLVIAAAKVWDRWPRGLALILVLAGFGGLQTRPATESAPNVNVRSAQAFRVAGGLVTVAGVLVYVWARRRRA
jgi:uncharacterized protein YjeT (DUF2065 family)